jgi:predicted Rossmann fold nucleotide-binding protein DprA/Smf involved in DNA uptake
MVDDMAKSQSQDKPNKAKPASKGKPKPTSRKKARSASIIATKKVKPKGRMPIPATEKVLRAIKKSKKEVDNKTIVNKTGLDRKQVANALSQLKKTGKVKSVKRGVHKAT